MFVDFSGERDWSQYAFVIVGSGFAGQFLAEKLAKSARVLLLEAGGREDPLALGEGYYEIESSGIEVPRLGSRLSSFGGTSNHWTGQSHPFSRIIFKDRVVMDGWPIHYEDYGIHLPEAQAWLGLPKSWPSEATISLGGGLFEDHEDLREIRLLTSNPVPFLGAAEIQRRYAEHESIDVLADTRVLDMNLDAGATVVGSVDLMHRPSRERRTIPVRNLILCAGGIENARLMLWAGRKHSPGNPFLGGPNHLTGKFFTEHPVLWPVDMYVDGRASFSDGVLHEIDGRQEFSVWLPSDAFLERHDLLRFGMLFQDTWQLAASAPEVADLEPAFLASTPLITATRPTFKFEQTPHEASRLSLLDGLDQDGVGRTSLHWEILPQDLANYQKATMLMCELLGQKGFARTKLRPDFCQKDWSGVEVGRSTHHIGTTRMGRMAGTGVVDTNCKVFGLGNLYIAGASVFPHGDFINPTMNFLALAARLACFLQSAPAPGYAYYRYGAGRSENCHLVSGWSHPEKQGVWTDAAQSVLRLPRQGARSLTLFGHAYREVDVVLAINGIECYRGPAESLMRMSFALDDAPEAELRFAFAQLRSPSDYGESDDQRSLGFFLERIEVR